MIPNIMGITCKPLGKLKSELKKLETKRLKEKTAMNRAAAVPKRK